MANRYLTPWSGSRQWSGDPLFQLQREIDRVFDDVFSGGGGGRSGGGATTMMNAPRIDLHEAEGELCLHADLPGMQPSDLDVRLEGDVLTISGERKSEQNRNERDFHVMERSHGRFQRSVQLPFAPNADEVRAEVRHGVLEVHIPKRAAEERSRRIQIRGGDAQEHGGGGAMTQAVGGGGAGDSERARRDTETSGAVGSGNVGQGPGGSSSSTPGTGSGAQGGEGGGMAGVAGGPTSVPVGQSSSSSPSGGR